MYLKKKIQEPLRIILRNPGINVNELIKQTKAVRDPKKILDELEKQKIIFTATKNNQRQLFALVNEANRPLFETVEREELEKTIHLSPYIKKIADHTDTIQRILGPNLHTILIHGSTAKQNTTPDSDVDILFIVENTKTVREDKIANLFHKLSSETKREIMPLWMTQTEFGQQLNDPNSFASQTNKNRILLYGANSFIKLTNPTTK